ncbi:MAG: BMP family ABC transporter substrate-binding protein [Pseudanabaena sp.]|nr:MAG: BMP family ABC transporter substrate-binding protein [Pseudanabaena sp.]
MGIITNRAASIVSIKHIWAATLVGMLAGACNSTPTTPTASPTTATTAATTAATDAKGFKAAMILVGPRNDSGWNQGHYEASKYIMEKQSGVQFDYVDKVNPGDRPNVKASQLADDLIAKGAKLVFFNSDDFKDDALETAKKHPDVSVIHATGDYAWKEGKNYKNQKNLSNVMPQIEYGRMISGCAAALNSETGKIGFVGPLINDETRRLVSATYLGAKYCWQNYRKKNPEDLKFKVVWIGFWFNIPGQTLDPTKVSDDFYNSGYDVVMSGIDTPEVAVQGKKAAEAGKKVKYLHYGLKTGCNAAPEICVGVPYYNWGPSYLDQTKKAKDGKFTGEFISSAPNWKDLNNPDSSGVGFRKGKALTPESDKFLTEFITGLGDGKISLFKGPLNYQDGTPFLKEGETATPQQIWYFTSLLQGIEGASK